MYEDRYKMYNLKKCENKPRIFNLYKNTVKIPSCGLSNTFANLVVREQCDCK